MSTEFAAGMHKPYVEVYLFQIDLADLIEWSFCTQWQSVIQQQIIVNTTGRFTLHTSVLSIINTTACRIADPINLARISTDTVNSMCIVQSTEHGPHAGNWHKK